MNSSEPSWRSEEWCDALAIHFFGPAAAQQPVLYFIDEQVLAGLYHGDDTVSGVDSLSAAVRALLVNPERDGYFSRYVRNGRKWKLAGGDGRPPFLDLLAICVLAAARMGTQEVSPGNYRYHLCHLLGLDDAHMPSGFDDLYYLWDVLSWWLDDRTRGERGISTIVKDPRYANIGYPISQTLFRSADARQLDDFFRWIALAPGEAIDEDVLVAHFRAWAPGRGLSRGAERMLEEPAFDEAFARILVAYAHRWDGTRSSPHESRRATLRVVVKADLDLSIALLALQPAGYPNTLTGRSGASQVTAGAVDGVYELDSEVEPRMLTEGLRLGASDCQLVLAASEVYVLRLDTELGGWGSVDAIEPGERHWLLVAPGQRDDVRMQLQRSAQQPGYEDKAPGALPDWAIIRNVVYEGAADLTGALATKRPSHRHRFSLRGGLPLRPNAAYLAGGAPDVWLPDVPGDVPPSAFLDGGSVTATTEQIRLADHISTGDAGPHTVEWGGISRHFMTIASNVRLPPQDGPLAHALKLDAQGRVVSHHAATSDNLGDVSVSGALVDGPRVAWRPAPVLLHRGAKQTWLLGAEVGQVHEAPTPPTPGWLARAGLGDRLYEAHAKFTVAWVVTEWKRPPPTPPARQIRLISDERPHDGSDVPPADTSLWCELLASATLTARDERTQALLEQYRDLCPNSASEDEPS
jgi:hypothetical protein